MKRESSRTSYSTSNLDGATGDNSCLVPNAGLPHLSPEWRSGCARYELESVGRGIGSEEDLGEDGEREMLKLGEKRKREREERRCGGVYSAICWWLVFFPSHRAGRSIIGRCIILDNEIEVDRIRE